MIIGLLEAGKSVAEVSALLHCSTKTVNLWQTKYEIGNEALLEDHRKNNHRPRKTTPDENQQMIANLLNHPSETLADIVVQTGVNISDLTVRRRFKEAGLMSCRAAKKPSLTDNHRRARIQYAHDFLGWGQNRWAQVIWSDEKLFSTSMSGKLKIWRPRCDRLKPQYVFPDTFSNRQNVMFWGCMTSYGVMALQEVSSRMNAEVLEEVMLPAAREVFPEDDYRILSFVQDNSAVHTARIVTNWFDRHPEILLLPHPAKSSDLNPIKNIWSYMNLKWRTGQLPRTRNDLRIHVQQVWARV